MKCRPTTGLVREALFNILRGELMTLSSAQYPPSTRRGHGRIFVDLFAGSGLVGLEACKEMETFGITKVFFVEKNKKYAELLIKKLQLGRFDGCQKANVLICHYAKALIKLRQELKQQSTCFPVMFADPPYFFDDYNSMLQSIKKYFLACSNGILILEHHARETQKYQALMENKITTLVSNSGEEHKSKLFHLTRGKQYGETMLLFYRFYKKLRPECN